MKSSTERLITPDAVGTALTLLGCLLIVLLGVELQSRVHINHDVGWIAHSAGWLLDGKRFGTDILDPNPPLAWFLMLPAAAAARSGILPEIVAIQSWNWLLTIAGLVLSAAVLLPLPRPLGRMHVVSLLVTSVAAAAILPVGNFGQRDVLAFLLVLPYVFSMMGRVGGAPAEGRGLQILLGFSAGFGFCLKPFLLSVPVLLELLQLLLTRNFRALIRIETVAMALTVMTYVSAILLFARDYLDFALPLIRAVYWAYDDSGRLILDRFKDSTLPAAYALGIALVTFSFNRMHAVLVAAIAGFSISYWVQAKGFPYHAFPMLAASCIYLAYSIVDGVVAIHRSARIKRREIRWLIAAVVLLVALPVLREPFSQAQEWYRNADRERGDLGRMRNALIDRLRSSGIRPTDYLYALSTHPNPGFPTVNYLQAQWAGRTVTQFAIPALVRRSEVSDPAILREIDRAVALQLEIVVADLSRHRPKYVMVEARQWRLGLAYRPFDDVVYYRRNPAFARLWDCYDEIDPVDQIRLFRRRDRCQTE